MVRIQELNSVEEWNNVFERTGEIPLVLFKHSTRCPVSAEAYEQFLAHVNKEPVPGFDYALVLVVESRPVSNEVAETLSVKHESPQVILIKNKQAVWHTSHWRITVSSLKENLR